MVRKSTRAEKQPDPPPGKVSVKEERRYIVDQEPEVEEELFVEPEPEPISPIEEFLRNLPTGNRYKLHAFVIPNYFRDGRLHTTAEGRTWVMTLDFDDSHIDSYREIAQSRHQWALSPEGRAMFTFELRENGLFKKRWEEVIAAPPPGSLPAVPAAPAVIVNPAPAPDPIQPVATLKEQMGLFGEVVDFVKKLMPPPEPRNGNGNSGEGTFQEKLAMALIGRQDFKVETLSGLLGGPSSTNFWDTASEYAPLVGQGLNAVLIQFANRMAISNQQAARDQAAAKSLPPAPAATGATPVLEQPQEAAQVEQPEQQPIPEPQPPQGPPPDPFQVAWLRTMGRLVEDCGEQVRLYRLEPNNAPWVTDRDFAPEIDVRPAAESIYALTQRFSPETAPEQSAVLRPMISELVRAKPEDVLKLCAMQAPHERAQQFVISLIPEPAALEWIRRLQEETREIFKEAQEQETQRQ